MERQEIINLLLPELNDIQEELAGAYKFLYVGSASTIGRIPYRMQTIINRGHTVIRTIQNMEAKG